jgi:hypothetical protein
LIPRFFCAIDEGTVLTAARPRNPVAAPRSDSFAVRPGSHLFQLAGSVGA